MNVTEIHTEPTEPEIHTEPTEPEIHTEPTEPEIHTEELFFKIKLLYQNET